MTNKVYEIKVSLKNIEPEIWRTFKINGKSSFYELHAVIQLVMGWYDSHLFEFENKNYRIGESDPDFDAEYESKLTEADDITVEEVLIRKGSSINYLYDFGDHWEHQIKVVDIIKNEIILYPVCTGGKRNCPPEDCGGIGGYEHLLGIVKNKKHPEYSEMMEWLGGEYDPEQFEIDIINKSLNGTIMDNFEDIDFEDDSDDI
ncbi:plasmid pRiA4b ORF-3 family protein [Bacteroidales bacterium]|nr:plasmid pRiA4b ORF-3 family protein [Bacteroidales bacterium]